MPRLPKYPFLKRYASRGIPQLVQNLINRALCRDEGTEISDEMQDRYWKLKELADRVGSITDSSPTFVFVLTGISAELPKTPKKPGFHDLDLKYDDVVSFNWRGETLQGNVMRIGQDAIKVDVNGKSCDVAGSDILSVVSRSSEKLVAETSDNV